MRTIFSSFLLLIFFVSKGQTEAYKDSLDKVLKTSIPDSAKARVYFELSNYWKNTDTLKARLSLNEGIGLIGNNKYLAALATYYEGIFNFRTDTLKTQRLLLEADKKLLKFSTKEAYLFRSKLWMNYGITLQTKDLQKEYLEILLQKALPFAEKSGDAGTLGIVYAYIAMVFKGQRELKKTLFYYDKAIPLLAQKKLNRRQLIQACIGAAETYLLDSNANMAEQTLLKARAELGPNINEELGIRYYRIKGQYYNYLNKPQSAITNLDSGIVLIPKVPISPLAARNLFFDKYQALKRQKKYREAKTLLLKTQQAYPTPYLSTRLLDALELASVNELTGNMQQAYTWQKEYSRLSDSFNARKLQENHEKLELQYNTTEKEKQILNLQLEKNKTMLDANKRRNTIAFLIATVFLLMLILMSGYLYYRSNKRSVAQKEKVKIAEAMLNTQEAERTRIAYDLHDGLGGALAGIKINLSSISDETREAYTKTELKKVTQQLSSSIKELRHIAHNMTPYMLERSGLQASLKDLCNMLAATGIQVQQEFINISNNISKARQLIIYRIVQELFSNILKHAAAKNVLLQCTQQKDIFFITIDDDGTGFNYGKQTAGMGIKSIENRVHFLNGSIDIISDPDKQGTSINIELDVKE